MNLWVVRESHVVQDLLVVGQVRVVLQKVRVFCDCHKRADGVVTVEVCVNLPQDDFEVACQSTCPNKRRFFNGRSVVPGQGSKQRTEDNRAGQCLKGVGSQQERLPTRKHG